jgi:hypothetical protein
MTMSQESFITGIVPYSTQEREKMREARVKQYISQQSVSASSSNSLRKSPVRCHPTCQPSTVKSSRTTKKKEEKRKTAQKKPQNKYNNINLKSLVQFLSFFDNNNPNKRTKSK